MFYSCHKHCVKYKLFQNNFLIRKFSSDEQFLQIFEGIAQKSAETVRLRKISWPETRWKSLNFTWWRLTRSGWFNRANTSTFVVFLQLIHVNGAETISLSKIFVRIWFRNYCLSSVGTEGVTVNEILKLKFIL